MPMRYGPGVMDYLDSYIQVWVGGQNNAIARNEKNPNEEPADDVRLRHIELTRTRFSLFLRMWACIWNSG